MMENVNIFLTPEGLIDRSGFAVQNVTCGECRKKKKQRRICPSNFQITSVLHIFSVLHFDSFMREYLEVLNNFCKT